MFQAKNAFYIIPLIVLLSIPVVLAEKVETPIIFNVPSNVTVTNETNVTTTTVATTTTVPQNIFVNITNVINNYVNTTNVQQFINNYKFEIALSLFSLTLIGISIFKFVKKRKKS